MKKSFLCVITLIGLIVLLSACASASKESQGLEFSIDGDGNTYVSGIGTCTDADIVIPKTAPNGEIVSYIDELAFADCTHLTSITIPDSITSIGNFAFRDCSSLTSLTIPASVTSIGDRAFIGCSNLANITVQKENPIYHSSGNCLIETTTKTLMLGCQNSIIPTDGSVTIIDHSAFYKCTNLTRIEIPASVTTVAVELLGGFYGCTNLEAVTFEEGSQLTTISDYAFSGCTSLTSIIIPNSVTSIGSAAFSGCTSLTSIIIPNSVTSIGSSAFSGCAALTSITIPDGVTNIDNFAFRDCFSLTSLTIPASVTFIGAGAFNCCDNLTLFVDEKNPIYHNAGNYLIETDSKTLISVCSCKNNTIPVDGSVTTIGGAAFSGCTSLTSITIPNSVTSIGSSAFSDCTSLTSIIIPNSVTSIGGSAFSGCTNLASIVIPDGVISIGHATFYGCAGLTSIVIPDSVTTMEHQVFEGCTNLMEIVDGVYYVDKWIVDCDSSVTSVSLCKNTVGIASDAFSGCQNLTNITIPNSVTSICGGFFYCYNLTNITFEGTVEQWATISKGASWNDNVPATEVSCSDGTVSLK